MNLNNPARLKSLLIEHRWFDEILYFRKLTTAKWREFLGLRTSSIKDESDEQGGFAWGAKVLSACLCDSEGNLTHDSNEKRAELEQLSNDEMEDLLRAALKPCGLWKEPGDEQKKS